MLAALSRVSQKQPRLPPAKKLQLRLPLPQSPAQNLRLPQSLQAARPTSVTRNESDDAAGARRGETRRDAARRKKARAKNEREGARSA
jgi:hypothetical protein